MENKLRLHSETVEVILGTNNTKFFLLGTALYILIISSIIAICFFIHEPIAVAINVSVRQELNNDTLKIKFFSQENILSTIKQGQEGYMETTSDPGNLINAKEKFLVLSFVSENKNQYSIIAKPEVVIRRTYVNLKSARIYVYRNLLSDIFRK